MRARRHFQPSFELMPMRLAPSSLICPDNPLASGGKLPPANLSPADTLSPPPSSATPGSDPGAGSYTRPPTGPILC